jgi:hypothetical protein
MGGVISLAMMIRWAIVVCLLAPANARAGGAADLVFAGQALAKTGEYSRAIALFKQADALEPRAEHACLIALTYTRRELWSQAEIFLATCHARARENDPAPEWIGELDRTLATKLGNVEVAPIAISVEPGSAAAMISISSFPPDETFTPRVVHLAPGSYTVRATAPGYGVASQTILVVAHEAQQVVVRLVEPRPSTPWYVVGAGGALVAAGLVYDLVAVQPVRDELRAAARNRDGQAWLDASARFDRRRDIAIALFAGGTIVVGIGLALRLTHHVEVTASPTGVAISGAL